MIPKKLLEEIQRWISEKRYGSLQINFQDGKIVNVNRTQSIKVDDLEQTFVETKVSVIAFSSLPLA